MISLFSIIAIWEISECVQCFKLSYVVFRLNMDFQDEFHYVKEQNYELGEPQLKSWFQCLALLICLGVFFSPKWYPASLVPIPLTKGRQRKIFWVGGEVKLACFQNQTAHQSRFEKGSQEYREWVITENISSLFPQKNVFHCQRDIGQNHPNFYFCPVILSLSQLFFPCFWCCPDEMDNTQI